MSMGQAISSVFRNYFVLSGRARRSEYWFFTLFELLIGIGLGFFGSVTGKSNFTDGVGDLFAIAVFFPGLSVTCRRLHDIGKSCSLAITATLLNGAMLICDPMAANEVLVSILLLVSGVVDIVLFIRMMIPGNKGPNTYGPDPKAAENNVTEVRTPPALEPSATNVIRFCRECGQPLEQGSMFCRYCGKKIF